MFVSRTLENNENLIIYIYLHKFYDCKNSIYNRSISKDKLSIKDSLMLHGYKEDNF